jgi:PEP-CTERM motif
MKLSTLALATLLASGAAQAQLTTINFDGALQTDITHAYAGLTFSAPLGGTGPVRTWAAPNAHTPGNVLGLSGQNNFYVFNQTNGAIDIVFDVPVNHVDLRAAFVVSTELYSSSTGNPFMAVYNSTTISAANRIGLEQWDIAGDACNTATSFCVSGWDNLSFTSTASDIKAIRLTGFAPTAGTAARYAMFDTLSYGVTSSVPEPSSLLMSAVGALGLWLRRRRAA